ncbi:putative Methyltransferase type 11 [Syntrophobacter sp. SbD1]|nr:putative Methyltransferase type 11 [Syntrophobacter sp. SbD1]
MQATKSVGHFSHVSNFTGYMQRIYKIVSRRGKKQKILDIPAGNGLLSDKLRQDGHLVVSADINRERPEFVYANMGNKLPFCDADFDTVVCLEGLEHLVNPQFAISELCRVCRNDGYIVVSIPNIQNCYSRLNFLCKGFFFQFPPYAPPSISACEELDLGHLSPLTLRQVELLFHFCGAKLVQITGDRWKRWYLMPIYLTFLLLGLLWIIFENGFNKQKWRAIGKGLSNLLRPASLFSRSLILVFQTEEHGSSN